jgi:lysophospholipase L1-like esterase
MTDETRRRVLRVAAAGAAVFVAFSIFEIALRAALGARFHPDLPPRRVEEVLGRHDPDLGWSLTPGAKSRIVAERAAYDVVLNSRGYRDAERGPRAAGARRIALLGDSYAFGWGVAADDCVGALLERDPRVGAEVVNLCVPGYSTDQELWTLEREAAWSAPDLVLVQFCPNDVEGAETTNAHRMLKPMFYEDAAGRWLVRNRPTATFLPVVAEQPSWADRELSWSAVWQVASGRTPLFASSEVPRAAASRDSRERDPFARGTALRHAFEELVVRCREMRATLVVFGVPTIGAPTAPPVVERGVEYLYELNQGLARLGAEIGFATVSVDRALHDAHAAGRVVTVPDGHWNTLGHRLAAEALAPQLAEHLATTAK